MFVIVLVLMLFILVLLLLTHRVWMMPDVQHLLASVTGIRYFQERASALESVHHKFAFTNAYAMLTCGKSLHQSGAMYNMQHNSLNTILASSLFTSSRTWRTNTMQRQSNSIRDRPYERSYRRSPQFRHCEAEARGCGSLKPYNFDIHA